MKNTKKQNVRGKSNQKIALNPKAIRELKSSELERSVGGAMLSPEFDDAC